MRNTYIAAAALIAAVFCLTSCHEGKSGSENGLNTQKDSLMTNIVWTKSSPSELEVNPFNLLGKDWMALATGSRKGFNSMTIAWGTMGQLWNKPVMIVYVSKDRYSKKLMDSNEYFTVTGFPQTAACRDALEYIGSHSQRDEPDKTANAGLTVEFTQLGNPIFSEGNLAIECKKIYSDEFESDKMPESLMNSMYSEMGMHTMYIGEIVNVWEKKSPQE
ncbi:MAG: flavin reductase [Bacteroidia bacterium]|nr:flavin reductase [Bacteroidia bacterium]